MNAGAVRRVAAAAAIAVALAVGCTGPITEDDPRWDCRTMGNRVCADDVVVPQRITTPLTCSIVVLPHDRRRLLRAGGDRMNERFIAAVVARALRIAALTSRPDLTALETVELDELRRRLVKPPAGAADPRAGRLHALEIIRQRTSNQRST